MVVQSSASERLIKALWTPEPLTVALRGKIREVIETWVQTGLDDILGAVR